MKNIENNKVYYSQKDIISAIYQETGYSTYEIERILDALEFIIQEKLGGENRHVEMTLVPGLKLSSKIVPAEKSGLYPHGNIKTKYLFCLSAKFTKAFKNKLRCIRRERENNVEDD